MLQVTTELINKLIEITLPHKIRSKQSLFLYSIFLGIELQIVEGMKDMIHHSSFVTFV